MIKLVSDMPLVSVYMPTHYRGILIERAIESVINQSYENIELIVCVDGKDEQTISLLNSYVKKDRRIEFIVNDSPKGACFARNRCIQLAKGKYITGIDDDDEFTKERISIFVKLLEEKGVDIISASRIYKDTSHISIGDVSSGIITFDEMCNRNLIGNQIFTKTEYLRELNGFDESFLAWQDYDMWFRLLKNYGNCYKTSEPTYIFYVDSNRPRITTGSNSHQGYKQFIYKHSDNLSKKNLKNLFIQDILNRNEDLSFLVILKNFTIFNIDIYIRSKLKKIKILRIIHEKLSNKKNHNL